MRVALYIVLTLLLVGCAGDGGPTPGPHPTPRPTPGPTATPTPTPTPTPVPVRSVEVGWEYAGQAESFKVKRDSQTFTAAGTARTAVIPNCQIGNTYRFTVATDDGRTSAPVDYTVTPR